jgi:predicted dehydrogenase
LEEPVQFRIALIGAGFVGSLHARAYAGVPLAFGRSVEGSITVVADSSAAAARALAARYGIKMWTTDWASAVGDEHVDVVDVCTPPNAHREIGLAALEAGKHVICEKPLGRDVGDARALADAAQRVSAHTLVGYNYAWAPVALYARQLIREGTLGQLRHFRALSLSDHASDEAKSWSEWGSWRWSREVAGFGALNDYGSHAVHMALTLVGEISHAIGQRSTLVADRPIDGRPASARRDVDNDDHFAALLTFENGCTGVIEASRVATGGGGSSIFVQGSKGALRWNQTQMNELELYVRPEASSRHEDTIGPMGLAAGFAVLQMGAWHPIQAAFAPSGVGLVETKTLEAYHFLQGIATGQRIGPTFADGLRVAEVLNEIAYGPSGEVQGGLADPRPAT